MRHLTISEINALKWAVDDVLGYLSDNSCSDPDCCGGPFYEIEQFRDGVKVMEGFGLTISENVSEEQ